MPAFAWGNINIAGLFRAHLTLHGCHGMPSLSIRPAIDRVHRSLQKTSCQKMQKRKKHSAEGQYKQGLQQLRCRLHKDVSVLLLVIAKSKRHEGNVYNTIHCTGCVQEHLCCHKYGLHSPDGRCYQGCLRTSALSSRGTFRSQQLNKYSQN